MKRNGLAFFLTALLALSLTACGASELAAQQAEVVLPEPDIHDIGILASTDPMALDQACYDLVAKAEGNEALMNRIARQHGLHTLEHAEEIGLGSRTYTFVDIGAQS